VPSRPPDHQLTVRHGHGVRRPSPPGITERSITDFQSQFGHFTVLGTADSSGDPAGAFGRF
jgi:hypothetical protein